MMPVVIIEQTYEWVPQNQQKSDNFIAATSTSCEMCHFKCFLTFKHLFISDVTSLDRTHL